MQQCLNPDIVVWAKTALQHLLKHYFFSSPNNLNSDTPILEQHDTSIQLRVPLLRACGTQHLESTALLGYLIPLPWAPTLHTEIHFKERWKSNCLLSKSFHFVMKDVTFLFGLISKHEVKCGSTPVLTWYRHGLCASNISALFWTSC